MRAMPAMVCLTWCVVVGPPRGCARQLNAAPVESVNYQGTSRTASDRLLSALADNLTVATTPPDDLVSLVRTQPPKCIFRR